jgi:hypothetical protein
MESQNTPGQASPERAGNQKWLIALVLAGIVLLARGHLFGVEYGISHAEGESGGLVTKASAEKPDFQVLVGDWVRPDGGYVIRIRDIHPDGGLDAGYFNPRPINVSKAVASVEDGKTKVFIELRDRGYPGSTYKLVYNAANDMLLGVYYQAAMKQYFEVMFVRRK